MINYKQFLVNGVGRMLLNCKPKRTVLVNSIPKAGTNLLLNYVRSIPGTEYVKDLSLVIEEKSAQDRLSYLKENVDRLGDGLVYVGHIPYSQEISEWMIFNDIKSLFIYRDPRDVTISACHYIMQDKIPKHPYYDLYKSFGSDYSRLMAVIEGFGKGKNTFLVSPHSIVNIKTFYDEFEGWLDDSNTLSCRYEDFITNNENLKLSIARQIIELICERNISDQKVRRILNKGTLPEKSHTFRKGRVGDWKAEYTPEHINKFNVLSKNLLYKWGYTEI